jgi:hypothetical protein
MRTGVGIALVAAIATACLWLSSRSRGAAAAPAASAERTPVIVELFSSEGCSSCPPADAYAASLDRAQPIPGVTAIVLEEHVDYWDRLGWRDPFGNPAFSDRQSEYARVLEDHHVFTPEIVFDGRRIMPGGDEDAARAMMQEAARSPRAHVTVKREGARLAIDVSGVSASAADDLPEVWLAITESGLATDVPAGENAGRRLAHAPIVRRLRRLGEAQAGVFHGEATLDAEATWRPGALRAVAFVQLAKSRRIVGAGAD